MMFFMNISIVKNKNVAAMRGGQNVVVLLQVALVVSFIFSAVFLFYTNSFLMKRRTKEIGLYNILGMEKKHISFMMLFENVIITIISPSWIVCRSKRVLAIFSLGMYRYTCPFTLLSSWRMPFHHDGWRLSIL